MINKKKIIKSDKDNLIWNGYDFEPRHFRNWHKLVKNKYGIAYCFAWFGYDGRTYSLNIALNNGKRLHAGYAGILKKRALKRALNNFALRNLNK